MLWFNRFKVMNRLVSGVSGRVALFACCFGLCVSPSVALGSVNLQLANLKQDMELVSRELAGLRTEVELLRRENAQLRVSVEQLTRRQNSASGTSQSLTQQVDARLQALERRASQGEKEQIALRKNIDKQLKDLLAETNKLVNPPPLHPVLPPRLFPRITLKRDSCTKSKKAKRSAVLP